ncbi:hypothetical protein HWV07_08545 [Natronomonas salina]|uniref:hypothetical protein n=1 Tax=Natronomonas salina TaxID=1710540 RepID=UPI0015B631BF|nr:hypothetical protein [Natronomonas salina]QLD89075.1 hypothetical protein HWV07_08545 [Natronomonas salina]
MRSAIRLFGSGLACTLLLGLLAGCVFIVLLLPLAILATLHPTLAFGGVPPTQYPPTYLAIQAVWTVLFGLGLRTIARGLELSPASIAATALPEAYPSTPRNERVAGLIAVIDSTDQE